MRWSANANCDSRKRNCAVKKDVSKVETQMETHLKLMNCRSRGASRTCKRQDSRLERQREQVKHTS